MDSNEFLTLHCLTLKQLGTPEAVETIVGVPADEAQAALARFVEAGDVKEARGAYVIMPTGRDKLDGLYPEEWAAQRGSSGLAEAYQRFEKVNLELKGLITDWQTARDDKTVDRLAKLHTKAGRVLGELSAEVPRLARYEKRLGAALDKVDSGEVDYVSGVRVDSYHTVWYELHEDLLRVLGETRHE